MKNNYNKYLKEIEIGKLVKTIRESKKIMASSLCYGICSASTLSKIENGDRLADYLTLNALFERLGVKVDNFEMLLDDKDYMYFNQRNEINKKIEQNQYDEAIQLLKEYEKLLGNDISNLHKQYILLRTFQIYKNRNIEDKNLIFDLLKQAINCTVIDYQEKLNDKLLFSENELECILELIDSYYDLIDKELQYELLITYCQFSKGRYGRPYDIYFKIAERYAWLLYSSKKYKKSLRICEDCIEEASERSELLNKPELYYLLGLCNEALIDEGIDKNISLKNYLIAYNMYLFFGNEEKSEIIRKRIEDIRNG